jgi:hypothetical protein
MSEKRGQPSAFDKLQESLQKVGEGLRTVGERLGADVAPGVERARLWADFSRVITPLLEAAPGGRMTGEEIESALADGDNRGAAAVEARKRKADFLEAHGTEGWDECVRSSGTLGIERTGGKTRITKLG